MKNKKITIGRMIITLFILILVVVGGTYAWLSYNSKKSALVLTIGDINNTRITLKPYQIVETMSPVNTYTSGVYSNVEIVNNGSNNSLITLYYKINELSQEIIDSGLKYTITSSTSKNGEYQVFKTGDFTSFNNNSEFIILEEIELASNTSIYYRVYLWLDSSVANQTTLQNTSLNIELNGRINISIPEPYSEPILNGAAPVLDKSGMIPVTISDTGVTKTVSIDSSSWYSYENQEWANVILTTSSSRSKYLGTNGVTVTPSDILAYYVWIPRYKYKIWTTELSSTGSEQPIDIVFEGKDDAMTLGTTVDSYRTHPAFWWDSDNDGVVDSNETLAGIWVGKFETSQGTSSNVGTSNPTILPDVQSWRSQNVSTQFTTSLIFSGGTLTDGTVTYAGSDTYGLSSTTNSHMMKNNEWGAVAYLSHSIYGANREIYINNSKSFYTGRSGGNVGGSTAINTVYTDQTSTAQYNNFGYYTWDGYLLNYDTNDKSETHDIRKVASTTGNITGIYDMSGGAWEYIMGVLADSNGKPRSGNSARYNSGFNGIIYDNGNNTEYTAGITFPTSEYYDLYTSTTSTTACGGGICYGHALSETEWWYSDYANFVSSGNPWFKRGGNYNNEAYAGAFFSYLSNGSAHDRYSWRSALFVGGGR